MRQALTACETSGHAVSDHFAHVSDMVIIGSGPQRQVEDVHLARYACYLIVQNADPEKPIVALGQTYFAIFQDHDHVVDISKMVAASQAAEAAFAARRPRSCGFTRPFPTAPRDCPINISIFVNRLPLTRAAPAPLARPAARAR